VNLVDSDSPPAATDTANARLATAIRTLKVTQAEVARRTEVGATYISDVVHSRRPVTNSFAAVLQAEFGIDKLWLRHGEGEMFRRQPPEAGIAELADAGGMVSLPLLDAPCPGNPLDAAAWASSTHPVPRNLARPSAPDCRRYVLRIDADAAGREFRKGDLVLVENLPDPSFSDLVGCWCTVGTGEEAVLRCVTRGTRARGSIWGRCVALVWRELPGPS
jgi:transcriptional regulator with XRE-family HTH domain